MYQGDFPYLYELYKKMRVENVKFPPKNFDDVRMIMKNIPKLNDVPILLLDQDYIGDKEWSLKVKDNEVYKALGALAVLKEYLDNHAAVIKKNESKIRFLY